MRSVLLCWLLLLSFPALALAEEMVTQLFLNGENKGELFVYRTESGDFLLRVEDLKKAGLHLPPGAGVEMGGEPHLSLRSLTGVTFTFNEQTLTLYLSAEPSLLPRKVIDFSSPQARNVLYPKDSSLFLNYGLQYNAGATDSSQGLGLTNELGIRHGDYLFLTDTVYNKDSTQNDFVRLHTSVTRDDRNLLQRTVFGDLFASSGTLGSGVNMGGIGFSKVYSMDPYFITYPAFDFAGQAALPSDVEVYVNGIKVRTEHVAPGQFQLQNFSAYGGAGTVELLVRDSLGREQRYRYPYYSGDTQLLKSGLNDFSYNIGFRRDAFGVESNSYSSPVAVMYHRYGATDFLTVGFRAEGGMKLVNAGPQMAVGLWDLGVASLSLSGSAGGGAGSAGDFSYLYQNQLFNTRLFYQYFSPGYRTLAASAIVPQLRHAAGGGVGYTYPSFGSLSLDLAEQASNPIGEKRTATLGYTRDLPGNVNVTLTLGRVQDTVLGNGNQIMVGLNYTPKNDLTFSARHESTNTGVTESLQALKNPPLGEGVSYLAQLDRNSVKGLPEGYGIDPMVQYNGRNGIIRSELTATQANGKWTDQYRLGASGALVMLDGVTALTRPVTDSFTAVKVGDIEGVTVLYGAQDMGKTDASGRLILPVMSSYNDNTIAINDKDIPADYYFPQAQKMISPPLRSGSCLNFLVKKVQAITGSFQTKVGGQAKPMELCEATLSVGGKDIPFQSGAGGEFYIDLTQSPEFKKLMLAQEQSCASQEAESALLKPGAYRGELTCEGKKIPFSVTIPVSSDPMIDLGEVTVSTPTETEHPKTDAAPASAKGATALPPMPDSGRQESSPRPSPSPTSGGSGPVVSPVPAATAKEIRFRFGGTRFASDRYRDNLKEVVRFLARNPQSRLIVEGHADQIGSDRFNDLLSKRRAWCIVGWLTKMGVAREKIERVTWFGKRSPQCPGLAESCRRFNRRVLLRIVPGP